MDIQSNMTPVQEAAHRLLKGKGEVEGGKVDLCLALVPVLDAMLSYTWDGQVRTFPLFHYLPELAPRKVATEGAKKGTFVKDMGQQRARAVALNAYLGMNEGQSETVASEVISCIRAAVGAKALEQVTEDEDEAVTSSVSISEAGNLIVPVSVAYSLFDDAGVATAVGKVAFAEAQRDMVAEAKAFARFSGDELILPTDHEIWEGAGNLPVECSGAKQRQGKQPVSPYGDLPTNTAMLAKLAKVAVAEGLLPEAATRQGQTPEGDNSPVGKAASLLCKAMTPDATGSYPEAFTSAQVASFVQLRKLLVKFEKSEADLLAAEAAALLAAAKS